MAAVGVPLEIIGRFLSPRINAEATLRKHFAYEVQAGRWEADMRVLAVAFEMAISGAHERMTWWWLEHRVPGFQRASRDPSRAVPTEIVRETRRCDLPPVISTDDPPKREPCFG
jgi:hypothetical protein